MKKLTKVFLPSQSYEITQDTVFINNTSSKRILINMTGYCRQNVYRVDDMIDPGILIGYDNIKKDFVLKLKTAEGVVYCDDVIEEEPSAILINIQDMQ